MMVLGFDTATAATTVACGEKEARHEPELGQRPQHAQQLLGLVEQVRPAWEEIELIAVGVGPGSFTGLRIGVATARALAQARELPLAGVSSLAALARGTGDQEPVVAMIDARRGEVFAARYEGGAEVSAPAALNPDEAAALVGEGVRAVGDGAIRFRERLEAVGAVIPPDDSGLHRLSARHVCALAEPAPAGAVLPDYRRVPDAELHRR